MNLLPIQHASIRDEALAILSRLGAPDTALACEGLAVSSPITGELIGHVAITSPDEVSLVSESRDLRLQQKMCSVRRWVNGHQLRLRNLTVGIDHLDQVGLIAGQGEGMAPEEMVGAPALGAQVAVHGEGGIGLQP